MHWRRKWQPTPVFLPGESQGRWGLVGCRLWGRTESDTTEASSQQQQQTLSTDIAPLTASVTQSRENTVTDAYVTASISFHTMALTTSHKAYLQEQMARNLKGEPCQSLVFIENPLYFSSLQIGL